MPTNRMRGRAPIRSASRRGGGSRLVPGGRRRLRVSTSPSSTRRRAGPPRAPRRLPSTAASPIIAGMGRPNAGAISRPALAMVTLLLTGCTMWIDHFVFFPDRQVGPPPAGAEERFIVTEDGRRLHAWYTRPPVGGPVLLWSHGNAGNIDSRRTLLPALGRHGLGVLAYDYRGYGRSDGSPSERGVYLDATAVFDDLVTRGTDPATIVCFGESLGGAVSIELATRRRCAAVIAVSTFPRLADVARRHYG